MIISIWDSINKASDNFKDWIIANGNNPFLWTGLFLLGLVIFGATYRALHKDK